MKFIFSALLCSLLAPSFGLEDWVFGSIKATLPEATSDHSAVRSAKNGLIYLGGGCDAADGNVWSDDAKSFLCGSVTDAFYSFDLVANKFTTLASLPQARYRHSSAVVDNKVWMIGGRTLMDDLVASIDVFDIATGTWSTVGTIPDNYLVSDHTTFFKDEVYIAGGYDATYTAMTTVLKIGLNGSTFEEVAPLNVARGDIVGVASNDGSAAFVAGGFSHLDWCQPLDSVEEYNFDTNEWSTLPDLIDARGEIVLVESQDHLYSLGGEGPLDYEGCTTDTYQISTKTIATDRIEILMDGETEWKILESFPEERFRFAAVGIAEDDIIYTFGGQTAFDEDCQCFKTTNEVFIFGTMANVKARGTLISKEKDAGSSEEKDAGSSKEKDAGSSKSVATALVAGALTLAFLYA